MTLGLEPGPGRGVLGFRSAVMVFTALLLLVTQSVIARSWPIRVDAATLVVVFLALETSFWSGLWTALFVGYLAGLYSGVPAGRDAAIAVAIFVIVKIFVARLVGSRWLMVTTIGAMATAGAIASRIFVHNAVGASPVPWGLVLPAVPGQLAAAIVLAWPVFRVLLWVQRQLTSGDERG